MPAQCPNIRNCSIEQGLWTPAALRPSVWVKANDSKTIIVSGGVVTSVIDVSSGVPFSVTGSVGLDTSQLNNKPTLRLDNTSTDQFITAAYSYAGNELTLISLHRNNSSGGRCIYGRLFSLFKTGELDYNTTNGGLLTYGIAGAVGVTFYRNLSSNVTSSPTINDVWGCAVLTRSGTGVNIALDGGSRVSGTTASQNFDFNNIRIGNDTARVDSGVNGYIAENILITRAITQEEEDKLFGYLAWEWGRVTSLPVNHPYRFSPPRDNRILTRKRRAFLFMAGAAGQSGLNGSSTVTLAGVSVSQAGTVQVSGASSTTLTGVTTAATGTVEVAGASSVTLAGVSPVQSGTVAVTGVSSVTLGGVSSSQAGTVSVSGASSVTLGSVSTTQAGTVEVAGASSVTLAGVSSSQAGTVATGAIFGESSVTLAGVSSSQVGTVTDSQTGTIHLMLRARRAMPAFKARRAHPHFTARATA